MSVGTAIGTSDALGVSQVDVEMVGTAYSWSRARGVSYTDPLYSVAEKAALEGEFCSFAGVLRVATPVPVRLWTGAGDLAINDSAFDPPNSVFTGGGRIISLPAFQRIFNGLAERVTITLTGVTDDMRNMVYVEADDVRGAVVRLGLMIFDDMYQQLGPVRWLRRGRVDSIETDNRPGDRERIKTISFSIGSQLTGRKVPGTGSYTNADQQSRVGSEDDRFCERTPLMNQQMVIKWPT